MIQQKYESDSICMSGDIIKNNLSIFKIKFKSILKYYSKFKSKNFLFWIVNTIFYKTDILIQIKVLRGYLQNIVLND